MLTGKRVVMSNLQRQQSGVDIRYICSYILLGIPRRIMLVRHDTWTQTRQPHHICCYYYALIVSHHEVPVHTTKYTTTYLSSLCRAGPEL